MSTYEKSISLVRIINAPVETVFAAWTESTLMRRWRAPESSEQTAVEVDAEPHVGAMSTGTLNGPRPNPQATGGYGRLANAWLTAASCDTTLLLCSSRNTLTHINARTEQ